MGKTLTMTRDLSGPPDDVFGAWTDPSTLARWWWPHITDTLYRFDPRPGGGYSFTSKDAGIGVEGEVIRIERPHHISFTWRWLDNGVAAVEEAVDVDINADGQGTQITVTHHLDDLAGEGEEIRQGWEDVLDRLRGLFLI